MKDDKYLEVNNLSYEVNGQEIIKDLSFVVKEGEILVIIGPNGSGKTTLLKSIIDTIKPSAGTVKMRGKNVSDFLGKIGYVPQRFDFDRQTPITVKEFMALENCGHKEHGTKYIDSVLEQVGLLEKKNKKLGVLSGGEFQRMMIARSLLHEKELLIFDEPAAGIDTKGEETIYGLIAEINKKHKVTCLIVSHELSVVSRYADNVLCINKSLVCFGPPKTVINSKTLQDLYGVDAGLYHHHTH